MRFPPVAGIAKNLTKPYLAERINAMRSALQIVLTDPLADGRNYRDRLRSGRPAMIALATASRKKPLYQTIQGFFRELSKNGSGRRSQLSRPLTDRSPGDDCAGDRYTVSVTPRIGAADDQNAQSAKETSHFEPLFIVGLVSSDTRPVSRTSKDGAAANDHGCERQDRVQHDTFNA